MNATSHQRHIRPIRRLCCATLATIILFTLLHLAPPTASRTVAREPSPSDLVGDDLQAAVCPYFIESLHRSSHLRSILERDLSPHASWSVAVLDGETGLPLIDVDAERSLVPASTVKLLTGLAALHTLGPATRPVTELRASGELTDGVLHGDLIIVGGGDPTLGTDRAVGSTDAPAVLAALVQAVRTAGIHTITGSIVADARHLPDDNPVPRWALWEDVGNYYGAVISGLSWRGNEAHVLLDSGPEEGDPATVLRVTTPHAGLGTIDCRVRSGPAGSGDRAYMLAGPFASRRLMVGTIPPGRIGFRIRVALPDPPRTLALEFADALAAAQVTVHDGVRTLTDSRSSELAADSRLLHRIPGPTIRALVAHTQATSDNVAAEHLLALTGRRAAPTPRPDGSPGGSPEGIAAIRSFLDDLDIRTSGLELRDGSGLSRASALPALLLAQTLHRAPEFEAGAILLEDLPRSGSHRALDRRFRDSRFRGRLRGKTGSMQGVWAFAGVLQGDETPSMTVAIIINDPVSPGLAMARAVENLINTIIEW